MAIGRIKTEYVFLPPIIFRESLFFFIYLITSRYLSVIMHKLINFGVLYNEGKRPLTAAIPTLHRAGQVPPFKNCFVPFYNEGL